MVLRTVDLPKDLNNKIRAYMAKEQITNKEEAILQLIQKGLLWEEEECQI